MKNITISIYSMKPVWLREIAYAIMLAVCWNLCQNAVQAAYRKVDDFESYATGNVDGRGNWHMVGTSANSQVVADPVNGANKCLRVNAAWSGCYNTLASAIPAGSTATIFFRGNFPGQYGGDSIVGLSKNGPPNSMNSGDGDLTAGLKYNGWQSPMVKAYNNSGLAGVLNNTGGAWYKFWIVVNTTANTYTVYTNAAGPAAASGLVFQGGGSGSALRSFIFGGEGSNGGGNNYVDDIYIDYSGDSHATDPTTLPPAPANLTVTKAGANASLTWSSSAGATSYTVKRSIVSGGPYSVIGSPNVTSFTDLSVPVGYQYFYVVSGVNTFGEGPESSQATITFVGPPSVINLAATNIVIRAATLGAQVTGTGAEVPTVTLYYGLSDGGTNAGNWGNSVSLGAQSGAGSTNVTGLTPNTQYYYRAFAQNSAAGIWAPSSATFTTTVLSAPTMANQTVMNQMATTATLDGQVVSTGNENPTVTLFYGLTDGGTSTGAWTGNISFSVLGAGSFSQGVSGLTPNTQYYFRVFGQNTGGGSWAPSTASFTTMVASLPSLTNTLVVAKATKATLGGTLLTVGNDNPVVTIYYGATDGGTAPAAWGHSVNLGVQSVGSFAQEVSGLSMLSNYYFRCAASNIAGTAWAPSSTLFTTGNNSVATIVNQPATNIKFNSALLNGSVVDNGNDSPTVVVFFGPNDGGTNPAAWDRSITLPGLRNGAYSQIVWGLGQGITNYFRACAINSSGTNWASSSLSFSTPMTYPVAAGHYNNGLGITPPLGWSSWSARRKDISDSQMRAEADVMATTLRDHGYLYVNMDDGWMIDPGTACDAYGRFAVDSTKFPNGIKALADYIHSKGLKFGIYYYPGMPNSAYDQNTPILGTNYHARDIVVTPLTPGTQNPPLNTYKIDTTKPGAMEYAQSIANMLASWGVDYVKIDWVNVTVNLYTEAAQLSTALLPANSGRPIFVQFSNWLQVQGTYGADIYSKANGWRNNPDIEKWYGGPFGLPITDYDHVFGASGGIQRLAIGQTATVANLGAPGGWNDADSLQMGWSLANTGLSQNEKDMMYQYWAIATSAMLLGCDMISIDPGDLAKLQNDEIIACNQSPYPASWAHMANNNWQYFWKPSTDGGAYVMFANFGGTPGDVSINFASPLGLSGPQSVRNLMTHENLGTMSSLSQTLGGHTSMLFKIGGTVTVTTIETWRFANFNTTANTGTAADTANPDGDAWNNAEEYVLGTNPTSPNNGSPLTVSLSGTSLTLTFTASAASGPGYTGLTRYYDVETTTDLANAASWTGVTGYLNIVGANQTVTVTQPLAGGPRFYRLKVRLQ